MDPELQALLVAAGLTTPEQQMAYLQQMMQPSIDPFMMGNNFDLDDANDQVDYGRDFNTLTADNMTAALAGVGGYGGNSMGLAADAFAPTIERRTVEPPNTQRLARALQAQRGSVDRWIAESVALGLSPSTIMLNAQQLAREGDAENPELDQVGTQLAQMQRVNDYGEPVPGVFDLGVVEDLATTLWDEYSSVPPGAIAQSQESGEWQVQQPDVQYDPTTGEYFVEEEEPSPQMEWYRERGIPTPDMRYELGDFSAEGGAYEAMAAERGALAEQLTAGRGDIDERVEAAMAKMLLAQDELEQYQAQASPDRMARSLFNDIQYSDMNNLTPYDGPPMTLSGQPAPAQQPMAPAASGQPGGIWSIFGDEAGAVKGALDPFKWVGKSAANALAGDESPWQGDAWSPWGGGSDTTPGRSNSTGGVAPSPGSPGTGGAGPSRVGTEARLTDAAYRRLLKERSQIDLPIAYARRDADEAARRAQGQYFNLNTWERPAAQQISDDLLRFKTTEAAGRTPTTDALRNRAMASYMMGGF